MAENRASAYTEGVPCWTDAQLPDVEAGKRFYGELFGWSFEEKREYGGSVLARLEGKPVAALTRKADGRMPTEWTVYFSAPDARALSARVRERGGQILGEARRVGPYGAFLLAADPQGAVFGLWQPGLHQGFGLRHRPGAFGWVQLYARDTETANAFYGALFHEALFGPGARPDFGRAAVSEVFDAGMPPHFLVHFRVADLPDALAVVDRLGGRVRAAPFETSYGTVAVVADDQGASFALQQR
ncbi:VOC family protein [Streptomyces sp. NPDC046985]|uniref:VOC family protein n=1 Tax=Streptomyces sp. NPDC046985 TaxID=3155377 RepID=UPI003400C2DE